MPRRVQLLLQAVAPLCSGSSPTCSRTRSRPAAHRDTPCAPGSVARAPMSAGRIRSLRRASSAASRTGTARSGGRSAACSHRACGLAGSGVSRGRWSWMSAQSPAAEIDLLLGLPHPGAMSGPFLVHATNSIDIPFTVLGPDGNPDTTTAASASTGNGAIRVGIRPDTNLVAFVDGLSQSSGANVLLQVTEGGIQFSDSFLVTVATAPNRGGIAAGTTASAEDLRPASRRGRWVASGVALHAGDRP